MASSMYCELNVLEEVADAMALPMVEASVDVVRALDAFEEIDEML